MSLSETIKNIGKGIIIAGTIATLATGCTPELRRTKDVNGDGFLDIMVERGGRKWVYLSKESSSDYLPTKIHKSHGLHYLKSTDGSDRYFVFNPKTKKYLEIGNFRD